MGSVAALRGDVLDVGHRVSLDMAGRQTSGTVVEDRGVLGGRRLLRIQLDWKDVAEPVEAEIPEAELRLLPLTREAVRTADLARKNASKRTRGIIDVALRQFRDVLRHRSMGLWPDHLANAAQREGLGAVAVSEAEAVLDELWALGLAVKRSSGIYISTSWLFEYIDETKMPVE